MLRTDRPERLAFYESRAYLLAKGQLKKDRLSSTQQRVYFNLKVISFLIIRFLTISSDRCTYCGIPVSNPSGLCSDKVLMISASSVTHFGITPVGILNRWQAQHYAGSNNKTT